MEPTAAPESSPSGDERWLPVPNWEDCYAVSSHGRVRNIRPGGRGRRAPGGILAGSLNAFGYRFVILSGNGERWTVTIHRLVCAAFIGPRPEGLDVCHNDGNRTNNHLANLRYDTRSENIRDAVRHGTHVQARKTHCKNGHELTPENATIGHHGNPTWRRCQACRRQVAEVPAGYIPVREAAAMLGYSEKTFYLTTYRYGDFPPSMKIVGRRYFEETALRDWRKKHPSNRKQAQ